jgi:hypothetical protein
MTGSDKGRLVRLDGPATDRWRTSSTTSVDHKLSDEKQRTYDNVGLRPATQSLPGYVNPGGENRRFGAAESQTTEVGA